MNLLLWTTHVTEEHFLLFAKLKQTGFDGIEVPLFSGDAAHYKQVRKELDNQGLGCTTVTCVDKSTNPISSAPSVRRAALDRIKWAIEMTAILGGENLAGPYHSAIPEFSGRPPTADEKGWATDVLRDAADAA